MIYKNTVKGAFISRPNRFIAHVSVNGQQEICHVKNTGRCRELLTEGAQVILEDHRGENRKTAFDLIAVYKGDMLINMDSQAPNKVVGEWLRQGGCFDRLSLLRPEQTFGDSRFDFYIEADGKRIFAEVKGVTLEKDGVVSFPDAPTERGVKHLRELMAAMEQGFEAYVFFVIQMESCSYFTPNDVTHKEFADTLREAAKRGVHVVALTCSVTENSLEIKSERPVVL